MLPIIDCCLFFDGVRFQDGLPVWQSLPGDFLQEAKRAAAEGRGRQGRRCRAGRLAELQEDVTVQRQV